MDAGRRQLFPEVLDGGAALRAHMAARGHKLEIADSSRSSCTVRTTIGPLSSRPAVLTITAEAVKGDGWDRHPVWRADPQRFLEGFATRAAARKVLAGEPFAVHDERSWRSSARPRRLRRRLRPLRLLFGGSRPRFDPGAAGRAVLEGARPNEAARLEPSTVRVLYPNT